MNLDSLRDRRPDLFPSRSAKKSKAELRSALLWTKAMLRALDMNKTRGTGKARVWANRLLHYKRGLALLIYGGAAMRELIATREHQLASTGGVEMSPNG